MKNLLIIIVIIALVGGAMYLYLEKEPASDDLLTGVTMEVANSKVGSDQLSVLRTLKGLVIDTSIFETKVWGTFRDSSHEIQEQPVSRSNPFAPINPNEISAAAATSTRR